MYHNGLGVKKDLAKAASWYEKAAEQGDYRAQNNLGVLYRDGTGVPQDYQQALSWFKKAALQGNVLVKENLASLESFLKKNDCDSASTQLFNTFLRCANRDAMMAAVKKGGASVKSENKNHWGDTYHTGNVLKGSSELSVLYTVDDYFASAMYTFPSRMDAQQIARIKEMVASKYGEPDSASGSVSLGEASFSWELDDGIRVVVSRNWPNTTTYLKYTHPENYQAMQAEQERQRKARLAKEAQAQSAAF